MAAATATVLLLLCAAAVVGANEVKAAAADDLVSQACTNVTRKYCRLHLSKDTCVSTLRSHERSAAARDVSDLALLAMELVGTSAAAADAAIGGAVVTLGGDVDIARSLQYCRVDYDDMARTVPECRRMVSQYYRQADVEAANRWSTFRSYFFCADRLRDAAMGCWDQVLWWDKVKEAVGKEVREVVQRATVAKAIQELMLGTQNPLEDLPDFGF